MSISHREPHAEIDMPGNLPQGESFRKNVASRRRRGTFWRSMFFSATLSRGVICSVALDSGTFRSMPVSGALILPPLPS
jgi:hypothetical protein